MSGFDANGNFSFTYNWVTDRNANIPITASRMDQQFADCLAGFNNCVTRDGGGKPSGPANWNGYKITNLGDPKSGQDAATWRSVQKRLSPRNFLINGDFRVWQRFGWTGNTGVLPTVAAGQYVPDRWWVVRGGSNLNYAVWQETSGIVPAAASRHCVVLKRAVADPTLGALWLIQSVDPNDVLDVQQYMQGNNGGVGNYLQFSVSLGKGANFSGTGVHLVIASNPNPALNASAGGWTILLDQLIAVADIPVFAFTGTTGYARFAISIPTATLPPAAQGIYVAVNYTPVGVAGADDSLHVNGALLEVTETPWDNTVQNKGCYITYPMEKLEDNVARCERYFQKNIPIDAVPGDGVGPAGATIFPTGICSATATIRTLHQFRHRMRATPTTVSIYKGSNGGTNGQPAVFLAAAWQNATGWAPFQVDPTGMMLQGTLAGLTLGQAYHVDANWAVSSEF
jgi:hypothetical protein